MCVKYKTYTVSVLNVCIEDMREDSLLYRAAKTHRIPYLYRSFSAKVTYI